MAEVNDKYGLLPLLSEEGLRTLFYDISMECREEDLKKKAKEGDIGNIVSAISSLNVRDLAKTLVHKLSPHLPIHLDLKNRDLVDKVCLNHNYRLVDEVLKTSLETVLYTHNLDAMMSVIKLPSRYNTIEWTPKEASVISLFLEALRRTSFCSRNGDATIKVAAALDQDIVYNLVSKNKVRTIKPIIKTIVGIAFWYRDPKRVEELILDRYEKGQKLRGRPVYIL